LAIRVFPHVAKESGNLSASNGGVNADWGAKQRHRHCATTDQRNANRVQ
jgi:hypothetical protein